MSPTERGGRRTPILSDYRPSWNLGNLWEGEPALNDGRVFLEDREQLAPGEEGAARLLPMAPQFWAHVREGMELPMQEGPKVVGSATVTAVVDERAHDDGAG